MSNPKNSKPLISIRTSPEIFAAVKAAAMHNASPISPYCEKIIVQFLRKKKFLVGKAKPQKGQL